MSNILLTRSTLRAGGRFVKAREPSAVLFIEKLSPAIEQVDGSSGAIGTAVNNAIAALTEIIATAQADEGTRAK